MQIGAVRTVDGALEHRIVLLDVCIVSIVVEVFELSVYDVA